VQAFKEQAGFLKSALFTGGLNLREHVWRGQKRSESVHGGADYAHKKTAAKRGGWGLGPRRRPLHQTFGRCVVVVLDAVFVPSDLAVEFVNQVIDCRIQVLVRALGKHIVALDMDIAFSALPASFLFLLFNSQQDFYVDDLIKVPHDAIQLFGHVTAQGRGNFQMMAADCQIHK
jgi:hypothetical protein